MIRPVLPTDAPVLVEIYNPYIRDTLITFEEQPVTVEEMGARIAKVTAAYPWLVWEEDGRVLGYAYGSTWRTRHAYRFAVETTVYLDRGHQGKGRGAALYQALLDELKQRGFHSALGCLSLPNAPSVRLHEKLGFRKVGHMTEAGWKFGAWVDVGFWELLL
ncbi:arsinothricin resistance N-acetyltransferase ArsN1 family B [Geothrix alkalitolerans]|uniref:arsinothricin resistance N-acetyltransferase ArsN1 family B n=1 Tax=Geothrix alkalitolerans TaxID=2922724 RepID=UPI001FAFE7DF|nr:arsinothricin resistance N-acetyltransferase ArsN1 family B [Geothrix alkalitolerans]